MSLQTDYFIHPQVIPYERYWVSPFGNLRIKALRRLPEAYRSLIRPSSPHDAKASVVRPYTLSKKFKTSLSRYVVILFNFQLPIFKDQIKWCLPCQPGFGGGRRIRTDGILLAKQTLYQLSYTPISEGILVGLTRVELVTSSLSGTRSNQLSYKPLVFRKGDGTLC